jgi:UDP-N-acetylglucosamine transferase subunit ALG13
MTQPAGEILLRNFRILVAPLDWGLGHTTRCIPIIKELLAQNCEVLAAGDHQQERLLRTEFAGLPFLPLTGYGIQYSRKNLTLKLISQIPKIIFRIRQEHSWLRRAVAANNIDAVISDNRFGLYHEKIPTVFITHQLQIKSKLGSASEKILRIWNYGHIHRFTECWVPDTDGQHNLSGELSHPTVLPRVPVTYIGPLSRFRNGGLLPESVKAQSGQLLFILSGPEPQRTLLEDKIIDDVSHYPGTATIVRGLPSSLSTIPSTGMIKVFNHLSADELRQEIEKAELVISRCGYSTVMDLVALQKKAILIPTPGQTEQEYLGAHLHRQHIAFTVAQKEFSLPRILEEVKGFNYKIQSSTAKGQLKHAIQNFLSKLQRQPN